MGGRYSRNKGKVGERKLATELREAFPEYAEEIRRGWQTREGDDEPDVLGVPGVWFEHKQTRKPNLKAAIQQAINDSDGGTRGVPIAVVREDRKKPLAVLLWSDLLEMLKLWVRQNNERHHKNVRPRRWIWKIL